MNPTTKHLTRLELYDLVWARPMTKVAADFGISSVAFAKHCRKLRVPTPPRGYWSKLRFGQKLPQPGLPVAPDVPDELVLEVRLSSDGTTTATETPHVEMPQRVTQFHWLVREIEKVMGPAAEPDEVFLLPGEGHSSLRLSAETKPRAMRLLHALFGALEARAIEVCLGPTRWDHRPHILAVVREQPVRLSLMERLVAAPPLSEEALRKRGYGTFKWRRPRELLSTDQLSFEVGTPFGSRVRGRWHDTSKRRLEDVLGNVILGIENAAAALRKETEERAEEERERKARDLERRAEGLRQHHQKLLAEDLLEMAQNWRRAQDVTQFLDALEGRVPLIERSQGFVDWVRWARGFASTLDPVSAPKKVSKWLEPDELRERSQAAPVEHAED